jgi:putative hydrolase of the HAD superfamily
MIRAVISDLGKVIVYFDNGVFRRKLAGFCRFSPEEIQRLAADNLELILSFDRGEITPEVFYAEISRKLEARIDSDRFFAIYNDIFTLNPPVLETLKRLKPRYKLALLSNTDVMRFGFIRQRFPEIFIFDAYVVSFELGVLKPDPRIYQEALRRLDVEPREAAFIDDMQENVEAAVRLGLKGLHFKPETNLEVELRKLGLRLS